MHTTFVKSDPFKADSDCFSLFLFLPCSLEGGSILSNWRLSFTISLAACKVCTHDPGKDEMSTSLTCCIIRKKKLFMNDEVTLCKCVYRACLCARRHRHLKEPLVFLMAWRASVFFLGCQFFCLFLFCASHLPLFFCFLFLYKALGANCR